MATATRTLRKFLSRPYTQRPGFISAAIGLAVGWVLVIGWFIAAALHFAQYSIFGYFEFLTALGFSAFTALVTFALVHEKNIVQELTIDDDILSLSTFDNNEKTKVTLSMAFGDVVRAEHYKAADTGSIVLRGRNHDLEIPTWCFDHETDLILVEILRDEHIPVLGVPHKMEVELEHHHHVA